MSGMKASMIYPTWPDIGGKMVPSEIFTGSNWTMESFINYDSGSFTFALMHFIHRGLAYLIFIAMAVYYFKIGKKLATQEKASYSLFVGLVIVQIILGILTLLNSIGHIPVLWGVLHQGVAVLVLSALLYHYYRVRYLSSYNS